MTFAIALAACGGSGGDIPSPTAPTGGSGGGGPAAAGMWTGTFSRPGGGTIAIRWDVTVQGAGSDAMLTGPMTLTFGANSATLPGRGVVSGNSTSGYQIGVSFQTFQTSPAMPAIPAFPNCLIFADPPGGVPFSPPYNRIAIAGFEIRFTNCHGLVDYPSPTESFLRETGQLMLTK
jgi:hypothetical protein